MNRSTQSREAGYNLVEVLVAMALLGSVLMSVITLFYFGRRNVYSGKQQTKITAVGTRVMEDMLNMTPEDILSNFNVGTTLTATCATINGVAYTNCIARKTSTFATTDDVGGFLARWKTLLGSAVVGQSQFTDPDITLIITPVAAASANSQFVRVRAILQWREGRRTRYSIYDASKLKRPDTNLTQ
jgi:prepilin-type N-terminal cleavage/methylation domain-containing protein